MNKNLQSSILYIDDDFINLVGFKALFKNDFTVVTAMSAAEGLRILEDTPIDIIISDQRMPKMLGTEFLKIVAGKYPAIRRFILSGFIDEENVLKAVKEGIVEHYFTKPCDVTLLMNMLKEDLQKN